MLAIRTILHPTDFSPGSEHAYRAARVLARDYGARLIVVHVLGLPPFATRRERERALLEPDDHVREVRTKLRELSHTYQILQGSPAAQIVEAARKIGADLIVMGTHGRTGLKRVLLGSVAEAVLHRAPCPVLTVKYPADRPAEAGPATAAAGKP